MRETLCSTTRFHVVSFAIVASREPRFYRETSADPLWRQAMAKEL